MNNLPPLRRAIDTIPVVSYQPAIKEINEKLQEFETLLKHKKTELVNSATPAGYGQVAAISDPLADGEYLADGGDVASLTGSPAEDKRANLQRQISAMEKAISILQNRRRHETKTVIQKGCQNLPDEIKQVFSAVIDRAQDLVQAIETAIEVDTALNKKGYETSRRPQCLQVIPYWVNMVRSLPGQPTLPFMIENQRKNWED